MGSVLTGRKVRLTRGSGDILPQKSFSISVCVFYRTMLVKKLEEKCCEGEKEGYFFSFFIPLLRFLPSVCEITRTLLQRLSVSLAWRFDREMRRRLLAKGFLFTSYFSDVKYSLGYLLFICF